MISFSFTSTDFEGVFILTKGSTALGAEADGYVEDGAGVAGALIIGTSGSGTTVSITFG